MSLAMLLLPVWIGLPLAVVARAAMPAWRLNNARWSAFVEGLRRAGFVMAPHAQHDAWTASGTWNGLPVEIASPSPGDTGPTNLTMFRIPAPAPGGRAGVYAASAVPLTELGTMERVSFGHEIDARHAVYAERPDEVRAWLDPQARSALVALRTHLLEAREGTVLLVDGYVSGAGSVEAAAELVTAFHELRAPRYAVPVQLLESGWTSRWELALVLPLLLGLFAGGVLAFGFPQVLSPLFCADGILETVSSGKSEYHHCDSGRAGGAGETFVALPLLVGFALMHPLLAAAFAVWARRRDREIRRQLETEPARPAGRGYRDAG